LMLGIGSAIVGNLMTTHGRDTATFQGETLCPMLSIVMS
jgi:hypothetical protein